jgi:hypothetical protein
MTASPKIQEFIERAKGAGASEQSLVGILTARGWPEKEVYEALAAHYERLIGTEIPRRGGAGTAAKDAFFHLLLFLDFSDVDDLVGRAGLHADRPMAAGSLVFRALLSRL